MARRRFRKFRRASGYTRGFFRRRSSKSSTSATSLVVPSLVYGAARNTLAGVVSPVSNMLPLGNYSDEAILGVAGYFMAKRGSGFIKQLGTAALVVESASIGNQLIKGGFSLGSSSKTGTTMYG